MSRSGGRGRLALGALLAAVLFVGGLVVLARGDDGDPDESLAAAQEVVESSESYRFELLTVSRQVLGDPDGAGSDTTTRSLLTGTIASRARWHLIADTGESYEFDIGAFELMRVGGTSYSTGAMFLSSDDVESPKWIEAPYVPVDLSSEDFASMYGDLESESMFDDDLYDSFALELVMAAYLSDAQTDPAAITRVVTESTEPKIEERLQGGGVRLRTRLAPIPALADVSDEPIPAVEVLLDLDAADQPVRASFTAEAGSASARIEITFSDWGSALVVDPPGVADVDQTPWLAEEALAAAQPGLLVAPSAPPDGLSLVAAGVFDGGWIDPGDDGGDCQTVDLSYAGEDDYAAVPMADPADDMSEEELEAWFEDMDYFTVSVTSRECWEDMGFGTLDDVLAGLSAAGGEGYWDVQVGDAVVTLDSSYDDEVIEAVAATLRPVTVEQLAAAVPEWARTPGYYGGFGLGGWAAGFGP